MLDRDAALQTVRNVYTARVEGDKQAMADYWAGDAHFEMAGERTLFNSASLAPTSSLEKIGALIDRFQFSDLELLDAVVEGDRVAARWEVTVATDGKNPVRTQLFDLITLNDEGKIQSFVQFADTALIQHVTA